MWQQRAKWLLFFLLPLALVGRVVFVGYLLAGARQAIEAHQYGRSQSCLRTAGILDAWNGQIPLLRSRVYRLVGDYNQAAVQLSKAKRLGIGTEVLQLESTLARVQQSQLADDSRRLMGLLSDPVVNSVDVCQAFSRMAKLRDDQNLLRLLLDQWWQVSPNDSFQFLARGEMWEDQQKWSSAEEAYRHVLRIDQYNTRARFGLGTSLLQQDRPKDAQVYYEQILHMQPSNSQALSGRAKCLSELGEFELAKKLFSDVLTNSPGDFSARLELGRLEIRQRHAKEAVGWLRPLAIEYPYNLDAQYHLALALQSIGADTEAAVYFRQVEHLQKELGRSAKLIDQVRRQPEDLEARCELGITVLKTFEPVRGLFWLNSVLARDPSHCRTHKALAEYYDRQGQQDLAAQHHRLGAATDSPSPAKLLPQ